MQKVKKKKQKTGRKVYIKTLWCNGKINGLSTVRAKDGFVYTSDIIDLDKPKTNWVAERGLVQYFFFARCFVAAMLYCEGDGRNRSKNFKRDITGLFISVLLFYKSNFQQTCHLYFSTPVCFPRTRILLIVFYNQILSISGEISKRHVVEGSDQWNSIFTSFSSATRAWMLTQMSCI